MMAGLIFVSVWALMAGHRGRCSGNGCARVAASVAKRPSLIGGLITPPPRRSALSPSVDRAPYVQVMAGWVLPTSVQSGPATRMTGTVSPVAPGELVDSAFDRLMTIPMSPAVWTRKPSGSRWSTGRCESGMPVVSIPSAPRRSQPFTWTKLL